MYIVFFAMHGTIGEMVDVFKRKLALSFKHRFIIAILKYLVEIIF